MRPPPGSRGVLGLLLALVPAAPALAVDPAQPLRHLSLHVWQTQHGLPQSSIEAIVQTRDGYLWLGTQEGLVRFDGVRFSVLDTARTPGMTGNHVTALVEAAEGGLWIGTSNGGLLLLRGGSLRAYGPHEGIGGDAVYSLAEDGHGGVWAGVPRAGLVHVEARRVTTWGTREGLPSEVVRALHVDRDGTLWAGTLRGLARMRDGRLETLGRREGLRSESVTALAGDTDGTLWVGTAAGLQRLTPRGVESLPAHDPLSHAPVRSLLVDREGSLWVGLRGGLVRLRDGRAERLTAAEGLPGEAVAALFEDHEGNLWVGTDGGGLGRLQDGRVVTLTTRDGLSEESIYSVAGDRRGGLWVGGNQGSLDHFDGRRFDRLATPWGGGAGRIRALLEDRSGRLWVGTDHGLLRRTAAGFRTFTTADGLPGDTVRALAEDEQGRVWVGTDGGGLARVGDGVEAVYGTAQGLASAQVRALLPTKGGLWIGTYGGLSRFRDGAFTSFTTRDGLPHNLVRCLLEDADGTLWVGTYGGGLGRYRDGVFVSFTTRQGLLSDALYQILDDGRGSLWFGCNRGIFRVSRQDLEEVAAGRATRVRAATFDESDGMRNRECNGGSPGGWRTPDGRLWFPTLAGLVAVDPARGQARLPAPPVAIEEMAVDGEPIALSPPLNLAPGKHRVEVRFTALCFTAPHRVRFSYRLDGYDHAWVESGTLRLASYTHLPPGDYTFRVVANSQDGAWAETGAALAFSVEPAFHQRRSVRLGAAAALLALGLGLHRLRLRRLLERERQLEARIQEAVANIKVLSGLLPICAHCKKIRDDKGYWSQIEVYIRDHTQADFSHSLCHDCVRELYPEVADGILASEPPPRKDEGSG